MMKHWLVKQEPDSYPWEQFVRDGKTEWTGVRNFQARNNLRAMSEGDEVFYYHSVKGKCVMGTARVQRAAYPDPSAKEGDWSCVVLVPVAALARPVSLAEIKEEPELAEMALLRQSRLSVMPVTAVEAKVLRRLGRGR
jgi:predicted RNA-binding protein with PUA-like domain